jgi:hypothetical protein
MTSTFNISPTAKTARLTGADFGAWACRVDSAGSAMRRAAGPRTAIVEASRTTNLDALAARSAG